MQPFAAPTNMIAPDSRAHLSSRLAPYPFPVALMCCMLHTLSFKDLPSAPERHQQVVRTFAVADFREYECQARLFNDLFLKQL